MLSLFGEQESLELSQESWNQGKNPRFRIMLLKTVSGKPPHLTAYEDCNENFGPGPKVVQLDQLWKPKLKLVDQIWSGRTNFGNQNWSGPTKNVRPRKLIYYSYHLLQGM